MTAHWQEKQVAAWITKDTNVKAIYGLAGHGGWGNSLNTNLSELVNFFFNLTSEVQWEKKKKKKWWLLS